MILANQIQFTVMTKYTINELVGIITVTDWGFIEDKNVNSNNKVRVVSVVEAGIISAIKIDMNFSGDYNINSNVKIDISDDPKDTVIYLSTVPATAAGLVFFQLNIATSTSYTAHNH